MAEPMTNVPDGLRLLPLSADAFAPFGRTITPPPGGSETILHGLLGEARADAGLCAKLDTHRASSLPFSAPKMERHEHSEQLFVPLGEARYVIAAALPGADGNPDLATLRGFLVTGMTGICYRRGTWHLPITILDRPTTFLMMMRAVGDPAIDTSWATLSAPLTVAAD
jgi:ureidoglycolate lyase